MEGGLWLGSSVAHPNSALFFLYPGMYYYSFWRSGVKTSRAAFLLAFTAGTFLGGCGPTPTPPAAPTPTTTITPAPTAAAAASLPAAALPATGLSERRLIVGGMERTYYLYVPRDISVDSLLPVVMVFHGYGQEGSVMVPATGFNKLADENGFLAVYPNGSGPAGELTWNAGGCCGYAHQQGIDEPAFVRQILADLGRWAAVDTQRIYATGFSNGGILAYRLACDMSDTLAAIASVSGPLFHDACRPKQPVSVIHIHGSADDAVPFAGGTINGTDWPPVEKGLAAWARFDECSNYPLTDPAGLAIRTFYLGCRSGAAVELYLIKDMGHRWPPAGVWPASQTIWGFFAAHPKR
jgi:polyhydroxybutyrate depolymerase